MAENLPATRSGQTKARDGKGKFVRTVESAERDAQAARLRSTGQTLQQIATTLGYADAGEASRGISRALAEIVTPAAEELRKVEVEHLDELRRAAMKVLARRHVTVSHGRIIRGDDGEPILDDGPELAAIDRLVRVAERRARLLGLDAPTKVESSGAAVAYLLIGVDDEALR